MKLMYFWTVNLKCGPNSLKYSGLTMVTEILGIFIAKHLNDDDGITLRDYIIERADGALIRVVWWTRWWIFIKIYLPLKFEQL